jgi:hypothetical protein
MPEPTARTIDQLETEYLSKLMRRDAEVWARRVQARDRKTTRPARAVGHATIRLMAQSLGCPKLASPTAWLRERGLIVKLGARSFALTERGEAEAERATA